MVEERRSSTAEAAAPGDGRLVHPEVRHERSDASWPWTLGLLMVGAVVAVMIHAGMYWAYRGYEERQAHVKRSPYPLAPAPSMTLPPAPRLEQLDRVEGIQRSNVYEREANKEQVLNSYGPTAEEGFVHIPISEAIGKLANQLPSRPQPSAQQRNREDGLIDGGEPNSGRLLRGKPRWQER
jgi:hypothetical protein